MIAALSRRLLVATLPLLLLSHAACAAEFTDRWVTPPAKPNPLLTHRTFRSEAMGLDVGYNIYLPPGYADPASAGVRFPVLYWLHGMNQSESADQYPPALLDEAIRAGKARPMIVVYASGGQRTFYSDAEGTKVLAETAVIRELIPHIDKTYRTIARREGRAIQGMSMGGFGALRLAFKYPEMFSSVVAFAPALRSPEDMAKARAEIVTRMFGGDIARFSAAAPETLVRKNLEQIRGKLPVQIYVGDKDYLLPGNRAMRALLTDLKIQHSYQEFPGIDHNLKKLSAEVKDKAFEFASKNFGEP